MPIMRVLQGRGSLFEKGNHHLGKKTRARRAKTVQGTARDILHDKKRRILLNRKIENTHNMRMRETSKHLCFFEEAFHVLLVQRSVQDLNSSRVLEIEMLSKIH